LWWAACIGGCMVHRSAARNAACARGHAPRQDLIARLDGSWKFTLVQPGGEGAWPLSRVEYAFRMWPKGEPNGTLSSRPGMAQPTASVWGQLAAAAAGQASPRAEQHPNG
jgi:hypothetical protein